jgi:hypothetical protein
MALSVASVVVGLAIIAYLQRLRGYWLPRIDAAYRNRFGRRSALVQGQLITMTMIAGYVGGATLVIVGIVQLA